MARNALRKLPSSLAHIKSRQLPGGFALSVSCASILARDLFIGRDVLDRLSSCTEIDGRQSHRRFLPRCRVEQFMVPVSPDVCPRPLMVVVWSCDHRV